MYRGRKSCKQVRRERGCVPAEERFSSMKQEAGLQDTASYIISRQLLFQQRSQWEPPSKWEHFARPCCIKGCVIC